MTSIPNNGPTEIERTPVKINNCSMQEEGSQNTRAIQIRVRMQRIIPQFMKEEPRRSVCLPDLPVT